MKHAGKARKAGIRLVVGTLAALVLVLFGGMLAVAIGSIVSAAATALVVIWIVFALFCLSFFRDPTPNVPLGPNAIVSPAHGTVDLIDETHEPDFIQGPCRRISIFLSVFDVHVQNAPVSGTVSFLRHTPGQFLNAMKTESAACNENVLIGIDSSEKPGEKVAMRLIAGLLARRIIPWVTMGESLQRGERTSLIQFGSRVDLYLPMSVAVATKIGAKVRGGETIVATRM